MLDTSRVSARLAAARTEAGRRGLRHQLEQELAFLDLFAAPLITRCTLFPDVAPLSFTFHLEALATDGVWRHWMQGALIYHGPRDQDDSDSAHTRAVSLTPFHGWQIHT
jgi:hypothetical protein